LASLNSYCSDCKDSQLSNVHLVNGCPHHGYTQKKHDGIKFLLQDMCKSARLLSVLEDSTCFKIQTKMRMDISVLIANSQYLIDVTSADSASVSNGLVTNYGLAEKYFPGIAAAMAAQRKVTKYKDAIHDHHKFYPFVIEALGRWGHEARLVFKLVYSKIPTKGSRTSRNFWAQKITIQYFRNIANNILHRFREMNSSKFGPDANPDLFYFDTNFGQYIYH
jgi:hypothetical protein